jgi:hypothetical protein
VAHIFHGPASGQALYNNRRWGFVFQFAGFRKDTKTGEARFFEAVFSDGTQNGRPNADLWQNSYKVAVELIVFDVRKPEKRLATYSGVFCGVSFDQSNGNFRCQIPLSLRLDRNMAFVLVAKPPYVEAELGTYKTLRDTTYFEGPWIELGKEKPFTYPVLNPLEEDMAMLKMESQDIGTRQVLNDYGYLVPADHYEWTKKGSNYSKSFSKNGKYGMRGGGNAVLIPTEYDNIHFEFSGFMIANKGGKEGVINEANEPIIPFEYKSLDILYRSQVGQVPKGVPLTELRLLARKDGNLWGILDGYGQVVFPFVVCDQPPRVMHFYEAERSAGGEIRSYPLNYENVRRRTAIYFDNSEKPALVNADGQPILTGFEKLNFVTFLNNVAYVNVQKEVKWGIYNLHGKWVTEAKYAYEPYLVEGTEDKKAPFFCVGEHSEQGTNFGLVDTAGRAVLPFAYDDVFMAFQHDSKWHFWVQKDGQYAIVTAGGHLVLPFQGIKPFGVLMLDGKPLFKFKNPTQKFVGLMTMQGAQAMPADQYTLLTGHNGKLAVALKANWEYSLLNTRGEAVLSGPYTRIEPIRHGYFWIQTKEGNGVAGPSGKVLMPPTYRAVATEAHLKGYEAMIQNKGIPNKDVVTVLFHPTEGEFAYLLDGRLVKL